MYDPLGVEQMGGSTGGVVSRFGRARYGLREYRADDPVRFKSGRVRVFGRLVRFELEGRHEGPEVAAASGRCVAAATAGGVCVCGGGPSVRGRVHAR